MLNMKKGLAIVLAAATALTFAPVSTLGLQGVVEAQAADADAAFAYTVNADNTVTAPTVQSKTVDASSAAKTVEITLAGLTLGTSKYKVTSFTDGLTGVATTETTVTADNKITATVPVSSATAAPKSYTIKFKVSVSGDATKYGEEQTVTITDTNADRTTLASAAATNFGNTEDTYYLRNVTDATAKIAPSYVQSKDDTSKYYDGSQLWYKVLNPTVSARDVSLTDINKEDTSTITGLKITAAQGSLTLLRTGSFTTFSGRLGAYKLDTDTNTYKLVGVKPISIASYVNETYALTLDQSSYTMALNTVDNTDALDKNVKISKSNGSYMDAGTQSDFLSSASWSVAGDNIAQENDTVEEDQIKTKISNRTYGNNIFAVYSQKTKKFYANAAGSTNAKVTITSSDGKIAQTTVKVTVIGTSQYVIKATVDGSEAASVIGAPNNSGTSDNPVVLDVKSNNTYDLSKHIYKNVAMDLSYESSNAKNTVDANGVVKATTPVESFYVKVTGKINGNVVAITNVYFKVNALPFNTVTVSGKDKDQATTLDQLDYNSVIRRASGIPSEKQLAASQIKYVQIETTGVEDKNVTESLSIVSTSGAIVTASLVDQTTDDAVKDVTNAGVITLNTRKSNGVAVIKLVSAPTSSTVLTTSYIFVVIDKADAAITAPDSFKLGTCKSATTSDEASHQSKIAFAKEFKGVTDVQALDERDDLLATQTLYPNARDINKNFLQDENETTRELANKTVYVATAENKTEKVLVSYNTGNGTSYQIVTITSVPGVTDSVTKIENATTGKVIYTPDMGTVIPELILDGNTTLKVTIAYPIDKNLTDANISSTNMYSGHAADALNQTIMTATKETKKKGDSFNTFYLYPTAKGTQVVSFTPSGNISVTDRSIVHNVKQDLAVTYRNEITLSKVTGLKVANKKGAAVSVSWKSQGANVLYRVYKKVGSGKWVAKNVAGTKTSLKVKKGAKVTVKVKAYKKTDAGKTVWGPKATQVTKKTDKK